MSEIICYILEGLEPVLTAFKPDLVLRCMVILPPCWPPRLAVLYQRIPIAHVEARLRTGNLYSSWPERANRKLTGHLATYHFAPTEWARDNLLQENIGDWQILMKGNTLSTRCSGCAIVFLAMKHCATFWITTTVFWMRIKTDSCYRASP
ncbi:MAG: UDP-N-acetylglucosamine 2-epimerase [Symbiopectobacterium sp.]